MTDTTPAGFFHRHAGRSRSRHRRLDQQGTGPPARQDRADRAENISSAVLGRRLVLTNKYAEAIRAALLWRLRICGRIEQIAIDRAKELFGAAANVQPHRAAR
jgi:hypothetical protein